MENTNKSISIENFNTAKLSKYIAKFKTEKHFLKIPDANIDIDNIVMWVLIDCWALSPSQYVKGLDLEKFRYLLDLLLLLDIYNKLGTITYDQQGTFYLNKRK